MICEKDRKGGRMRIKNARVIVQLSVLTLITVVGVLHQKVGGGPEGVASIHGLCPFGGIESFYSLVTTGEFIKKTFYSNLILIGGATFVVIFFGRIFCGWICALGTMQDIAGKAGKKLFKKRYQIPEKTDKVLRNVKYIVLIGIIYFTWKTGTLVINYMDPFTAYSHISAGWEELLGEYLIGFGILVVMLIASLFYERLFCRYVCPLGAYYAIIGRLSIFGIKRDSKSCIDCKKCDKACIAGLKVSAEQEIGASECMGCMECAMDCPTKKNSLTMSIGRKMVSEKRAGIIGAGIFFGIILITKSIGLYETTPNNISDILKGNPSNIRGWMTLQEVGDGFGVPLKKIYRELGVTADDLPAETPIKKSEEILRDKGIEFDHDKIGEVVANLTGKEIVDMEKTSVEIRGSMSIEDISKMSGLSSEKVIEKLGIPIDISYDLPLKNLAGEHGFEMGDVKERWNKK